MGIPVSEKTVFILRQGHIEIGGNRCLLVVLLPWLCGNAVSYSPMSVTTKRQKRSDRYCNRISIQQSDFCLNTHDSDFTTNEFSRAIGPSSILNHQHIPRKAWIYRDIDIIHHVAFQFGLCQIWGVTILLPSNLDMAVVSQVTWTVYLIDSDGARLLRILVR